MAHKKAPKKPKAKKLPKKPKQSGTLKQWLNYEHRKHAIEQHNKAALGAWQKAVQKISSDEKHRQAIIKKHMR